MCTLLEICTHRLESAVRTNIEIDDELIERALKISGLPTKRAVVEEALRLLIKMRGQASVRELFGKIPLDNNLEESRQGRNFDRR
jgi:Arc/MetJ family transcription regulator